MPARDKRRTDIAKFLEAVKGMRIPAGSPNEQAIWVILARHGTKEGATRACKALWDTYVSVNEFRVAKVTEVAELIEKHVKNDPLVAAEQARGFLRTYFKEWQMVDPAATEVKPAHELKKYLNSLESYGREIALALALHYCQKELEDQALYAAPPEDGGKPKKRPEKELTASANRMRLLFNYSAHGTVTPKEAHAGKSFVKSWAYKPLPAPKKAPKKAPAKAAPKKPAAAKKTPKKAPAKKAARKTAKKAPAKKAARKKTTAKKKTAKRTTRKRTTSKKSSRR